MEALQHHARGRRSHHITERALFQPRTEHVQLIISKYIAAPSLLTDGFEKPPTLDTTTHRLGSNKRKVWPIHSLLVQAPYIYEALQVEPPLKGKFLSSDEPPPEADM